MSIEIEFSSNAIRLSKKEIFSLVILLIISMFIIFPIVWRVAEKIHLKENFRLAYKLRDDYWVYNRIMDKATRKYKTIFLGDSVIWGMYVDNENTLVKFLNDKLGAEEIGNMAIDGLHSAAMIGLVRYYSSSLKNKKIILHYNPLWMNSVRYDLQEEEEMRIHHPRLIPQFSSRIKSYKEDFLTKIGIVLERHVSLFSIIHHIRLYYFGNTDFADWVIENPYKNPFSQITMDINAWEIKKKNDERSWKKRRIRKQDWEWVMTGESVQWAYFKSTLKMLQEKNNDLFIVLGPINPHIMKEGSLVQYRKLQEEMISWLMKNNVPFFLVPDMPENLYADASHPVKDGYKMTADRMFADAAFFQWRKKK